MPPPVPPIFTETSTASFSEEMMKRAAELGLEAGDKPLSAAEPEPTAETALRVLQGADPEMEQAAIEMLLQEASSK